MILKSGIIVLLLICYVRAQQWSWNKLSLDIVSTAIRPDDGTIFVIKPSPYAVINAYTPNGTQLWLAYGRFELLGFKYCEELDSLSVIVRYNPCDKGFDVLHFDANTGIIQNILSFEGDYLFNRGSTSDIIISNIVTNSSPGVSSFSIYTCGGSPILKDIILPAESRDVWNDGMNFYAYSYDTKNFYYSNEGKKPVEVSICPEDAFCQILAVIPEKSCVFQFNYDDYVAVGLLELATLELIWQIKTPVSVSHLEVVDATIANALLFMGNSYGTFGVNYKTGDVNWSVTQEMGFSGTYLNGFVWTSVKVEGKDKFAKVNPLTGTVIQSIELSPSVTDSQLATYYLQQNCLFATGWDTYKDLEIPAFGLVCL